MLDLLNAASVSDTNKKLIFDFVDYCFSEGLSKHRVIKYISILKNMCPEEYVPKIGLILIKLKKRFYRFISNFKITDKSHKLILNWKLDKGGVRPISCNQISSTVSRVIYGLGKSGRHFLQDSHSYCR
ncbi:hypothetical protein RSJ42_17180 [Methanosarcina hadiensis]|uniref:hypothetical protein n=1 Tax=Methanosarcina hadiensis TaxID=3078083 RepID=UPI0039776671